ncbi:MAG: HNH endonuclease [Candidatus Limnocylindrales bacterium]
MNEGRDEKGRYIKGRKLDASAIESIKRTHTGKIMSEETRRKIGIASKNRKKRIGWHHSEETRKKLSLAQGGEKNYFWKGGIYPEHERLRKSLEYKLWRTAVYERDNYTCVLCGDNRGNNLQADHIKRWSDYPELRFEVSNGRTLCIPCHKKTDTYGWNGHNNKIKNL